MFWQDRVASVSLSFYFLLFRVRKMRITAKGQVTIPRTIRRDAGLLPGTDVEFVPTKQGILIRRAERVRESGRGRAIREHLDRMRGSAGPGWTTEQVMELTRGEE